MVMTQMLGSMFHPHESEGNSTVVDDTMREAHDYIGGHADDYMDKLHSPCTQPSISTVGYPVVFGGLPGSGDKPKMLPNVAGTRPIYELCERLGIGAVGSGVGNVDSRNHAPNENILVDDYIAAIKYIATVIQEFASA